MDHFASRLHLPSHAQLQDQVERVFLNQKELNSKAYSTKEDPMLWVTNARASVFDYPLAAGFEIIELGNSWNKWNWWTKSGALSSFAMLNMGVEAVDALHFIASDILVQYDLDVSAAYNDAAVWLDLVHRTLPIFKDDADETNYIKARIKDLMVYAGSKSTKESSMVALQNLYKVAIHACGLDFKKLVTMYMGKSTLNQFRQDNGYREKKYTKVWAIHAKDGNIEDNHFLMRWIMGADILPKQEEIYSWLTENYKGVRGTPVTDK